MKKLKNFFADTRVYDQEPLEHMLADGTAVSIRACLTEEFSEPNSKDYLRFLWSLSPMQLYLPDSEPIFVAERTAMKVHPNMPISIDTDDGFVYAFGFHRDEAEYINEVVSKNSELFAGLEGRDKQEWDELQGKDLDYILQGERNQEHIIKKKGVVIAPHHSRHKPMATSGWHFLYPRASRAMGMAANYEWKLRTGEEPHKHNLSTELYVGISGTMKMEVGGKEQELFPGEVIVAEPGETHRRTEITNEPWVGIILLTPSIPGDRIVEK